MGLAIAQDKQVSGIVLDETGEPVVGASVIAKGTTIGKATDINGKFVFSVPTNVRTLVVKYVGYVDAEASAAENVTIGLEPDAKILSEVVVTALGIKRSEKAIGYAATTVNAEEITAARTSDIISGLAGKIAGVQINTNSSDPGASSSITIRGFSSLTNGKNQPLFVIDGVPVINNSVTSIDHLNSSFDFGNGANAINPEDVESMTILKGAAATTLYGSRAANGVILITSKNGKKQAKLGVEYNGGIQTASVLRLPEMQNEFGMGWNGTHTLIENGSWGPRFDGSMQLWGSVYNNSQKLKPFSPLENNVRDFFDTGFRYNNSVSYNGATDNSDYFVSFSQLSDNGILPTDADTYDRYTFATRASHTKGNLKLSSNVNYSTSVNKFAPTGQGFTMVNSLYQMARDISIVGLKDLNDPFNTPDYYYTPYGVTNPYYLLSVNEDKYKEDKVYGKIQLDYKFLNDFNFTYRLGLDALNSEYKLANAQIVYAPGSANYGETVPEGSVEKRMARRKELNHDLLLTYDKIVSDFNFNALAGLNANERTYSRLYSSVTGLDIPTWYNIANSASTPSTAEYESIHRLVGLMAQLELGYKSIYYLTLNARNDWSSTLPKTNNSYFYAGATGSFIFSEYLQSIKDVFTFGKIRVAWGQTGNDADVYKTDPYYDRAGYSLGFGRLDFPLSGVNAFTLGNILANPNLSPEITTEFEVGANLSFFKNRIAIDAAYYDRVSDKQIFSLNMDAATGYTAQNINLGKIGNKGVELLVNVKPIDTPHFGWDITWTYTKNESKVISLPEELGGVATLWAFTGGVSMDAVVGQPLGMFKAEVPLKDPEGHIVVNQSTGMPVADSEYQYVGNMNYDYEMGFGTSFRYKSLTLSADLDVRQGGIMYSRTKDINYFVGNAIQTAYNDRNTFIVPGSVIISGYDAAGKPNAWEENTTPIASGTIGSYWDAGATDMGSYALIDKSYVKLRSVSLGWDLPKSWLKNTFLEAVKISAFGYNLFVWTPQSNTFIDPEITTYGTDLEGKFGEFSANPTTRKFGVNLSVKF
jgi:TonB-linked SusC/RagA family outer membrane protein